MRESNLAALLRAAEGSGPRPINALVARLADLGLQPDDRLARVVVRGVTQDSRAVNAGSLFVAIDGQHADGHDFMTEAVRRGAAAALVEHPVAGLAMPQLVVSSTPAALAIASAWWYGDPSHELGVIGITGTDGKTTTSFLTVAALEAAGLRTGMLSTAMTRIGGFSESNAAHATTPEAPVLQAALRAMVLAGDRAAVVETTSHGLALQRVDAVAYDIAILTNLTHEHLDLHGSWEAYRDAKLSLFERLDSHHADPRNGAKPWPRTGIVNKDDPSASLFMAATRTAGAQVVTYGADPAADVRAIRIAEQPQHLRVDYDAPSGSGTLDLRLAGRFNVHNALAAVALGEAIGLDPGAVRRGLESVDLVPGRMERIQLGQPFDVIVDYAHSPASLAAVLDQLVSSAAPQDGLIAVFGSAGERDVAKRPLMGRIAGDRCRLVILTEEDPRGEDSEAILEAIARGAEAAGRRRGHDLLLIPDRRSAIEAAFNRARPGDTVLLAGKGHEQSIIGPNGPRSWDERSEAEGALRRGGFGRIG